MRVDDMAGTVRRPWKAQAHDAVTQACIAHCGGVGTYYDAKAFTSI